MALVPPHLESVLKSYRRRAPRSLRGPRAHQEEPPRDESAAAATTTRSGESAVPSPVPALSQPDRGRGERGETLLEGEPISCFAVGGERRLCLPQILTSVLTDFSLDQINRVCDELQIYCSRCTPEQLHELKATGVLPKSAPSCGLITKTDAQRLCGALLHPPDRGGDGNGDGGGGDADTRQTTGESFRVYHECFGKCRGVCSPARGRDCIECQECLGLFSPRRFVCHAHRSSENRTCHWGFDAANWRAYLLVAEDQPERERLQRLLDDVRRREPPLEPPHRSLRRKLQVAETVCKAEPLDVPLKKPKIEDFYNYTMYTIDPYFQAAALYDQYRNLSLRSWTNKRPFLSHEPPLLQHPEKVVHLKDSSRFELSYQPNVALKPHQPPTPPSSDEITSSTSPPPVAEVAAGAPPPDCELSTDTDDEDCKDLIVETAAHLLTDGEQPHIRKAQMIVKDKDAIIAEQAETIREKDAIIARQLELLKEKEALILKREQELREKEALVSEQAERLTLIEKRPIETTAEKPPTIEIVERPDETPCAEEAETSKRECE